MGNALEPALAATIGLIVLLGGTVAVLSRQGIVPWSRPALRTFGGGASAAEGDLDATAGGPPGLDGEIEATRTGPTPTVRSLAKDAGSLRPAAHRAEPL